VAELVTLKLQLSEKMSRIKGIEAEKAFKDFSIKQELKLVSEMEEKIRKDEERKRKIKGAPLPLISYL